MRKIIICLVTFCSVVTVSFAQETEKPSTFRSLSFYLDSFSGTLTKAPDGSHRAFAGHEFEFGVIYSQNFATVPWLSMWIKTLVVTGFNGSASPYTPDGEYIGTGRYGVLPWGLPRAQLGLNFGGWAILALDTRGVLATEAYYTARFGGNQAFTLQGILEIWAVPTTVGVVPGTGLGPNGTYSVVDLFEIRLNYEIGFAPGWTFRSKLGFRFGTGGHMLNDETTMDGSAEAFGKSFHTRWENQIVWAITPSFYTWGQIRYQATGIANGLGVDHQVGLQAGLGYSFDFSKN